jgi:pimeloyl-ACP methyl ester carboxylesterase
MVTWGYSGGGPPVLACAALLPDLVTAAAALAGLAPFDAEGTKDGLAPGNQGWWDDNSMQLRPWSFDLGDIAVPVLLLHGRQDQFVPPSHGEWLAAHIPGVEARWFDDDRHDTITDPGDSGH